ncbi:unnamed protein product [Nezara viridula]|uniref:Uncharacterized protein n=1 Tax=Nezara viridula TaxID=85310 RepID=A0A9P0E9H1_NEZVI|nr:unnamed protein product [Nezara viridula]
MVYESDFYTVRRPYSRPTITSYSVTAPRISVTTWRVKPSIRTSVLIGELDRIHHRSRPHLSYVPTEDFLNSRPLVDFDDETKIIRAETERLMKRIYTSVPHPRTTTPLQILPYYGHRTYDKYDSHRHYNTVSDDIFNMSHYNEPSARTIGRGHLACVSFAGGRGYPRRKHLYLDENRDIQDEIKFRSYYNKNRAYEDAMSLPTGKSKEEKKEVVESSEGKDQC